MVLSDHLKNIPKTIHVIKAYQKHTNPWRTYQNDVISIIKRSIFMNSFTRLGKPASFAALIDLLRCLGTYCSLDLTLSPIGIRRFAACWIITGSCRSMLSFCEVSVTFPDINDGRVSMDTGLWYQVWYQVTFVWLLRLLKFVPFIMLGNSSIDKVFLTWFSLPRYHYFLPFSQLQ